MDKKELLTRIYDTLFHNKRYNQFNPEDVVTQTLFEDGSIWFELIDGTVWEITATQLDE